MLSHQIGAFNCSVIEARLRLEIYTVYLCIAQTFHIPLGRFFFGLPLGSELTADTVGLMKCCSVDPSACVGGGWPADAIPDKVNVHSDEKYASNNTEWKRTSADDSKQSSKILFHLQAITEPTVVHNPPPSVCYGFMSSVSASSETPLQFQETFFTVSNHAHIIINDLIWNATGNSLT